MPETKNDGPPAARTAAAPRAGRTGRPRLEDRERREGDLLDVAETQFLGHGYVATTIEAIARAASVSKKTIYARYGDKKGLFEAMVVRLSQRVIGPPLPTKDDLPLREGLLLRLRRINAASVQQAALSINLLLISEGRKFPAISKIMRDSSVARYHRPFADYLRSCVARGVVRPVDCDFTANAILMVLSRHLLEAILYGLPVESSPVAREKLVDQVCDLFIDGLRPLPAPEAAEP